jgi:hypothetical protein
LEPAVAPTPATKKKLVFDLDEEETLAAIG